MKRNRWLFRLTAMLISTLTMFAMLELSLYVLGRPRPVTNFTPVQGIFKPSTKDDLQLWDLVAKVLKDWTFPEVNSKN